MTSFVFQEVPAESLRQNIRIISGNHSVLVSAGNMKLFNSSTANCYYAFELTFKPIAACFLRPQKTVIRLIEKNEYFTLSYFSPQYKHIPDSFGSGSGAEKPEPLATQLGNVYFSQADWVFECRKVFNLELILSNEIQSIMASEKKRAIYPGNETPRMFVGEIVHGWHKTPTNFAKDSGRQLPQASTNKVISSAGQTTG